MTILDRYVFRSFIEPFILSFTGFIAIWLIIDINDNFNDFIEAHARPTVILGYYVTQVPTAVMLAMPTALMLGLLFSLSRMSRTNEIVSQLTAGRSLMRVFVPLFLFGIATTGFCLWLNWERAPHAEAIKKFAMKKIRGGKKATDVEPIQAHLFRDRLNSRTWYVRKLIPPPPDGNRTAYRLSGVHITQQDPKGHITKKWYGSNAAYDSVNQSWKIEKGMVVEFTDDGDVAPGFPEFFPNGFRTVTDWSETPWRVASSEMNASAMSVDELLDYLIFNSDFPQVQLAPYRASLADRYALPFQCLVAVLIAAPLGVVFNRRGAIGGVTAAIVFLVIMIMAHYFFVTLGKGLRLNPDVAAWIPNAALALVGFVLLWYRSTNRDFPKFFFSRR